VRNAWVAEAEARAEKAEVVCGAWRTQHGVGQSNGGGESLSHPYDVRAALSRKAAFLHAANASDDD